MRKIACRAGFSNDCIAAEAETTTNRCQTCTCSVSVRVATLPAVDTLDSEPLLGPATTE
jgi:hypothetical protein